MTSTEAPQRLIVVVTGANSGVGYGICQRLFVQLCDEVPSDSQPQAFLNAKPDSSPIPTPKFHTGLTLIMACRSLERAERARTQLLAFCDRHTESERLKDGYTGRAEEVRSGLVVDVEYLDLAAVKTVFEFAERVKAKYPYISHLCLNAGVMSIAKIDLVVATKHVLTSPLTFVTKPKCIVQTVGETTADNMGYVWQSNTFGHFALFREVESLLTSSPLRVDGRVVWCSSLEASPIDYDPEGDWQLTKTTFPYHCSKFQIDAIATTLDHRSQEIQEGPRVRHVLAQPGIASTNVATTASGPILDAIKVFMLYMTRFFGVPDLPIEPYKAAIATVHLALIPLALISDLLRPDALAPIRFGADADRWGAEFVNVTPVKEWEKHKEGAVVLVDRCDRLLEELRVKKDNLDA